MKFGEKLKQARARAGLTQEDVIKKLGVTRQSLSNWENDRTYPDLASAVRLSDLYEIPLDDLLREDMELRRQMEEQHKRYKTRIFVLYDLAILMLASFVLLNWLGKPMAGFVISGLGLLLCVAAHWLMVRYLSADRRYVALQMLSMVIFWAGFLVYSRGHRSIGVLLWLLADIPEVYVSKHMQPVVKDFKHLSFFTGIVFTLAIVFCFSPFAGDAVRRGDLADHNPFSGLKYRVAEVVSGPKEDLPMVYLRDNELVSLEYPGEETIHLNGEFLYINQPEGAENLGVWELVDAGVLYRITVEEDETVTFTALEDDTVRWKYRLEYAPTMSVTVLDVLGVGTGSGSWYYADSFEADGDLKGMSLDGKGTIRLSIPGEEPTVTIYEEYRDGDRVEYNTLTLTRDRRGRVEFSRETRPDGGAQTGIYRIPYEDGEFVFIISYNK